MKMKKRTGEKEKRGVTSGRRVLLHCKNRDAHFTYADRVHIALFHVPRFANDIIIIPHTIVSVRVKRYSVLR